MRCLLLKAVSERSQPVCRYNVVLEIVLAQADVLDPAKRDCFKDFFFVVELVVRQIDFLQCFGNRGPLQDFNHALVPKIVSGQLEIFEG